MKELPPGNQKESGKPTKRKEGKKSEMDEMIQRRTPGERGVSAHQLVGMLCLSYDFMCSR